MLSKEGLSNEKYKIYSKEDLLNIFPFGKTKLHSLLQAGLLPVIKIGRDYLTNENLIDSWFQDNLGKELYY